MQVSYLLETFNNLLQYQYEGNYPLVYAMIRNRDVFTSLPELELDSVLEAKGSSSVDAESSPSSADSKKVDMAATIDFVPTEEWVRKLFVSYSHPSFFDGH